MMSFNGQIIFNFPDHMINGEKMSESEFHDLSLSLTTVHDVVERQGYPVFTDINTALQCTAKVIRDNVAIEDLGPKDNVRPVRMAHIQIGDKLVRLREAFEALDTNRAGKISLQDLRMAFRIHAHRDLSQKDLKSIISAREDKHKASSESQMLIDFADFCCIVSEFKHIQNNDTSKSNQLTTVGKDGCELRGKKQARTSLTSKVKSTSSPNDPENHHWHRRKANHIVRSLSSPLRKIAHRFSSKSSSSSCHSTTPSPTPLATAPSSSSALKQRRGSQIRDVYLGGTMKGSRWRERDAIPMLRKHGITFFNPQSTSCSSSPPSSSSSSCQSLSATCSSPSSKPSRQTVNKERQSRRLIPIEASAMENSHLLLFVILSTSRSVAEMCEAANYIGTKGASSVVLCVQKIPESNPKMEDGEILSKAALKDYNRGRSYLSDMANREGVPVFEDIHEAIECVLQKCKTLK